MEAVKTNGFREKAWEQFVMDHELADSVPAIVSISWQRCWSRLSPFPDVKLKQLTSDHLLSAQVANFDLLSIARPVMEDIYQYIEGSDTAITLVNSVGVVLDMLGDASMRAALQALGIVTGSLLSETEMGTNAFALAVTERVPVQVRGAEHYRRQYHNLTDAAAPIFDLSGKPMGAIGLFCPDRSYHPHSLGLVVAGARAIEAQRQADHLLGEQNSQLARLNAILGGISEGILVWNHDGNLIHANETATRLLNLRVESLKGNPVGRHIQFPPFVEQAIQAGRNLVDVEAGLLVEGRVVDCILSVQYVRTQKGTEAAIAILRHPKEVRRMIQRQVGAQAAYTLNNLIGDSREIRRVYRLAKAAAAARASVLLRGESGTGKNLLAQAIHRQSPRGEGPYVMFNCSSTPSELIVPELLGTDGQANLPGLGSRPSKFELADGGTLFIQDIDNLPLEAQAILLNVLELGFVQRQHSLRPIEVDVRIIAATTQPLEKLVAGKSFRSDLYFRLSAFEIGLPSLRERKEDLPQLAGQITKRLARQQGHTLELDPEALALLQTYHWPGNVRELETVLERAAFQAGPDECIRPEHLPDFVRQPQNWFPTENGLEKVLTLDEAEQEAILRAARFCQGNTTRMAEVLGIGRTTLWRKLKQWELEAEMFKE